MSIFFPDTFWFFLTVATMPEYKQTQSTNKKMLDDFVRFALVEFHTEIYPNSFQTTFQRPLRDIYRKIFSLNY